MIVVGLGWFPNKSQAIMNSFMILFRRCWHPDIIVFSVWTRHLEETKCRLENRFLGKEKNKVRCGIAEQCYALPCAPVSLAFCFLVM